MSCKTIGSFRHTLALRLTIWYAAIFAASSILVLAFAYLLIVAVVERHTDDDLREDIEEFAMLLVAGGLERLEAEIEMETTAEGSDNVFFRVWNADDREVMASDLSSWSRLERPQRVTDTLDNRPEPTLETLALPGREHHVRSILGYVGPGVVLQIGQSLEEDNELVEDVLHGFLIALATVISLGGPIGWFLARHALRGVEEVTRTANQIAAGALDQRVTVRHDGGELDRLGQTFNMMLDRIQALIVGMREMTDNLAHDLRSPLARIRGAAEMTLTGDATESEWQALAAGTTEECDRLLEIINTTLDIAEAESGAAKLALTEIDLADIIRNACELFQTVAEDREIVIDTVLPERCRIQGDLQRLQRVVANLLDNALKYTTAGGQVTMRLVDVGFNVELSVEDSGTGMSPEELSHIFRRFYRCDNSRSQPGNGLGLSLALAFARAHGGDIAVRSTPGVGSVFSLRLTRSLGPGTPPTPAANTDPSHMRPNPGRSTA